MTSALIIIKCFLTIFQSREDIILRAVSKALDPRINI